MNVKKIIFLYKYSNINSNKKNKTAGVVVFVVYKIKLIDNYQ